MFSSPSDIIRQCGVSLGSVVADFGVGTGAYAHELAAGVGPSGTVYAFDVQKSLIDRVSREVGAIKDNVIRPIWADLEAENGTTLANEVLDLGVAANVLFQIEHKERFMKEVVRVLRRGGRLLIVDWKESFGHTGPHPDHVVPIADAKKLALDAGLTFDKELSAGHHHYGLIFRKPL